MAFIGLDNVYITVALLIMISSSVCICNVVGGINTFEFRGFNG